MLQFEVFELSKAGELQRTSITLGDVLRHFGVHARDVLSLGLQVVLQRQTRGREVFWSMREVVCSCSWLVGQGRMGGSGCCLGEPLTGAGYGVSQGATGGGEGDLVVTRAEVVRQQTSRVEGLGTCLWDKVFFDMAPSANKGTQ